VKYLSSNDLQNIVNLSKKTGFEIWPPERISAYQAKNVLAKRAAVTEFLWLRYTENPRIDLKLLELWCKVENCEKYLAGPAWFRQQHEGEGDLDKLWNVHLGSQKTSIEKRHQDLIKEIMES